VVLLFLLRLNDPPQEKFYNLYQSKTNCRHLNHPSRSLNFGLKLSTGVAKAGELSCDLARLMPARRMRSSMSRRAASASAAAFFDGGGGNGWIFGVDGLGPNDISVIHTQ
jgi:hypothetical protein